MIELILILSAVILILGVVSFFSIKSNIKKSGEIKDLEIDLFNCQEALDQIIIIENEKTDIRNKANEIEVNIIDGTDDDVMPINKTKQSGSFNRAGGKNRTFRD